MDFIFVIIICICVLFIPTGIAWWKSRCPEGGRHNWQIIIDKSGDDVYNAAYKKVYPEFRGRIQNTGQWPAYVKVCLRCEAIRDTYSPAVDNLIATFKERDRRMELGKKIALKEK